MAEKEVKKAKKYVVNKGCSVTSKKGILEAGVVLEEQFFINGQKDIEALLKSKVISAK